MLRRSLAAFYWGLVAASVAAQGDTCSSAVVLAGAGSGVQQTTPISTVGFGQSAFNVPCTFLPSLDGYYLYVAGVTGTATFTTCSLSTYPAGGDPGGIDTQLVAYSAAGGCGALGPELACNDDAQQCHLFDLSSEITFHVTAGQSYYVRIGDWSGVDEIVGTLAYVETSVADLAGDTCSNPNLAATAGPGVYAISANGFVEGDVVPPCGLFAHSQDYWLAYTASSTGVAVISDCYFSTAAPGGGFFDPFDSVFAVWPAGACPPAAAIACVEFVGGCGSSLELELSVTAGTTYLIQISDWNGVASPYGTLAIAEYPVASNASCATALPIPAGTIAGTTAGGGTAIGPCGIVERVWYSATASCAGGRLVVDSLGSPTYSYPYFSAYDACGGALLGCSSLVFSSGGSLYARLALDGLAAGQTVLIAVGRPDGVPESFVLNVACDYVHQWSEPAGPGSLRLRNLDGPPNALSFSAITLNLLHPGLPPAQNFPNGAFFGVPYDASELLVQATWPGGLPFVGFLDPAGNLENLSLPAGATAGVSGAVLWSVGVAFDPLTGFTTIADVTAPTAFQL